MKLEYCYHTHTYRCGHASGKDEEYVLAAIENGYKEIGFTDHVFLPGYIQEGIRGNYEQLEEYISSINALKEKYKNQIKIHVGFECEYLPKFEQYYKELLSKNKVEYLIQGQHLFINDEDKLEWYFRKDISEDRIEKYADDLIKGMESKLFSYVAHPDVYVTPFSSWTPFLEKIAHKICSAAERLDMPLEINLGGLNPENKLMINLRYPLDEFWKAASQYKIRVFIGLDAHKPEKFKTSCVEYALSLVEKYHLNLQNKLI